MTKSEQVVKYLRETYQPVAVVLHGSRAVGKERPQSDWDIFMLFQKEPELKRHREQIAGEDVEWKAFVVPAEDDSILDTFDIYLQFAKVLWEEGGIGTELLKKAKQEYAKGPNLSGEDVCKYRRFMEHKLKGMEDDIDVSYMFFRHIGVFFHRAVNWYPEIAYNEYPKPLYIAFPEIQNRDPEYYALLMKFCADTSPKEKINVGHDIIEHLFEKK